MEIKFSDQRYILEGGVLDELRTLAAHYHENGRTPDDMLPQDLKGLLKDAIRLLDELPGEIAPPLGLYAVDVLSLGRRQTDEDRQQGENGPPAPVIEAAGGLSGLKKPFRIAYRSGKTPVFSIALQEKYPAPIVEGILRGAFGQVSVGQGPEADSGCFGNYSARARCRMSLIDKDGVEQPFPAASLGNWVDSAAIALPGQEYAVEMTFVPIGDHWLSARLDTAHRLCDLLGEYSETSWQASGNVGSSLSETDPLLPELKDKLTGSSKVSGNGGMGVSLSSTIHRTEAERLAEELRFHLARLSQMRRSGGWAVYLDVSAREKWILPVIQSVMNGALSPSGFSLQWGETARNPEATPSAMLPGHDLYRLLCFPEKNFPGFVRTDLQDYDVTPPAAEAGEALLNLGSVVWNGLPLDKKFSVPVMELNRHAFICGMTGSGKTNTVCHILATAGIPFMVIEPVKGEYRSLRNTLPNTEVYTMEAGKEDMLPINPFWFPAGSSLQYHIDSLRTIVASAFDLYAAMPNILEQCLVRVYINMGWDLVTSNNIYSGRLPEDILYPTFTDLCAEIEKYLDTSDFERETKGNYKGALLSRLQSFTTGSKGILLNDNTHTPFRRWLEEGAHVIIELDALADDADKCIVMGALLTQYFQFIKYRDGGNSGHGLRHLVVLEEAHHLFMEDTESSNGSYARRQMVETLSNLLAEIRAYGEGFLIIDQSPTRISPEVVKNTATKIAHRIDYGEDMEMMRDVLLLKERDKTTATLEKGWALVRYGIMEKPAMVRMPLCEAKEAFVLKKKTETGSRTRYSVRSALDMMLLNEMLREEISCACGMFVNQALFDGLPGIRRAMRLLWCQCKSIIYNSGYQELAASCGLEKLLTPLVLYGAGRHLAAEYPAQTFLHNIIKLYLRRLIQLDTAQNSHISPREWLLLADYRSVRIHRRLAEYYTYYSDASILDIRRICGVTPYSGILKNILSGIWNEKQPASEEWPEEVIDGLVREHLLSSFYDVPEELVLLQLNRYVLKYLKAVGQRHAGSERNGHID